MGFFDSVVAAPSRKAALAAWGARQDLFHEGLAAVTEEPEAVKAATARPGVVLRRAAGEAGPYREDAPPPDRSRRDAAEADLRAAEREHAAEAAELQTQREALERRLRELEERAARAEDAWASRRRALQAAVDKARRAWRRAGGT